MPTPLEDALKVAIETRNKILEENIAASSILRGCYVVAYSIGDSKNIEWIGSELNGYSEDEEVPSYRNIQSRKPSGSIETFEILNPIHRIENVCQDKKNLHYWDVKSDRTLDLQYEWCYSILSCVKDRCLVFLTMTIAELQYGGLVSSILDKIRKDIDLKLPKLSKDATSEFQSIYNILSSGKNDSDWSLVAHSSRRILKYVANFVFPAKNEQYISRNGKKFDVKEDNYINRLLAFLDKNQGGKIITAEINYLSSYLDNILEFLGKGEHSKIERTAAERIAVHLYLILDEVLKFVS